MEQISMLKRQVAELEATVERQLQGELELCARFQNREATLERQLAELRAELTGTLSDAFRDAAACYDTPVDHYREMARRLVEDRDVLKHRARSLEARAETAERQIAAALKLCADFPEPLLADRIRALLDAPPSDQCRGCNGTGTCASDDRGSVEICELCGGRGAAR